MVHSPATVARHKSHSSHDDRQRQKHRDDRLGDIGILVAASTPDSVDELGRDIRE
jgi:hypothetical protein